MKKIFLISILLTNILFASATLYRHDVIVTMPFGLNINSSCEKIEMTVPIYKKNEEYKYTIYGSKDKFLITCDNKNQIKKINFYKKVYMTSIQLNKNMTFDELKKNIYKNFRKHLVRETIGDKYSLLEVFLDKNLYQIFVYNNKEKKIEFYSIINMKNFPEYKYISKLKDKSKVPPLISWLFI